VQRARTVNHRYCIIGAGPSGLAQARAFRARGVDFDLYERRHDVGGLWDIDDPETSLYESAHFISSRTQSAFLGFPMPETYPDYPRHDQILAYLRAFADAYDLRRSLRLGARVERVTLTGEGGALVRVAGAEQHYAGVICATGVNWTPNVPEYPGAFTGTLRHTLGYRRAEELRDKRVLIIGLGNSGADIACDAARAAQKAYVSVRRGYYFIPKHIFGKPADVFAHEGPKLPKWLETIVFGWLQRLVVGDTTALGMPKPDHRILESHPLMNDQLLHHLRHGDVTLKPDVARFEGNLVHFTDGSSVEVDEVLTATGYRMSFPYLDEAELEWQGRRVSHFLTVFSRKHPGLFTLGFAELNGALYPHVDRLAALVAAYAQARRDEPAVAERFRALAGSSHADLRGGTRHIASERHDFYCDDEALKKATLAAFRRMGWKAPTAEDYPLAVASGRIGG
jgi:pyruvate/2-oxoglutarate dehydrogenase complex dihydrolipoamide dehydrogenase (E3) component